MRAGIIGLDSMTSYNIVLAVESDPLIEFDKASFDSCSLLALVCTDETIFHTDANPTIGLYNTNGLIYHRTGDRNGLQPQPLYS